MQCTNAYDGSRHHCIIEDRRPLHQQERRSSHAVAPVGEGRTGMRPGRGINWSSGRERGTVRQNRRNRSGRPCGGFRRRVRKEARLALHKGFFITRKRVPARDTGCAPGPRNGINAGYQSDGSCAALSNATEKPTGDYAEGLTGTLTNATGKARVNATETTTAALYCQALFAIASNLRKKESKGIKETGKKPSVPAARDTGFLVGIADGFLHCVGLRPPCPCLRSHSMLTDRGALTFPRESNKGV